MKIPRSLRYLFPLLVLVAGVSAWVYRSGHARHEGPPVRVTIAFSRSQYAALAHVAQARGYFAQEGVQVTPLSFSFGRPALQAVIDGKADFATVADPPIMFAVMKGKPVAVVATMYGSSKSHGIVALKERGVLTPDDLRGKRIATPFGTSAHFYLDVYLVAHGIPREEVSVVDIQPEEGLDVLMEGKADAVCVFDPFVTMARKKLAERVVTFFDEDLYRLTFNMVTRPDLVQRDPATVEKVLRALLRAEQFVARNTGEAQRLVAEAAGLDRDVVEAGWNPSDFRVTLDQSLVLALEDESRWAIPRFFPGTPMPNYLRILYLDGLDAVQPRAVRVLR